jgi:uroporphyrin-3 C-methyltransferase
MGNFVTITRRDTPIEPELPPKQQWFVRANVTSQLLAAQNASLNYKQKIYQTSIDQSLTWLRQYFDLSSPAVISAITTLEAIQNKQVELQLPAGLTTQPILKAYVAQQLNLQSITEAGNE